MSFNISKLLTTADGTEAQKLAVALGSLSATGIAINLAAFAYVIYSPKIRRPLKVTLFNLISCDCLFLTGVLIGSVVRRDESNRTLICSLTTVMIVVPTPVSYSAVLGLACYNFIAVFKATDFSVYVTTTRAVIITVVIWSVTILTSALGIVLGSRPDSFCSLLSLIPSFILVLSAVYSIVCSFGMVILNIAVAVKLRSTRSVSRIYNKNKVVPSNDAEDTFYKPDSPQLSNFLEVPKCLSQRNLRSIDDQVSRSHSAALNAGHLYSTDIDTCRKGHQPETRSPPLIYPPETRSPPLIHPPETSSPPLIHPPETSSPPLIHPPDTRLYPTISHSVNNNVPLEKTQEISPDRTNHRNYLQDHGVIAKPADDMRDHLKDLNDMGDDLKDATNAGIYSLPEVSSDVITENYFSVSQVDIRSKEHKNNRAICDLPSEPTVTNQPPTCRLHRKHILSALTIRSSSKEKVRYDIHNTIKAVKYPVKQTLENSRHSSMPNMSAKMRSTIVTLTILAFWNALLTLPTLAMWIWMTTADNLMAQVSFQSVATVLPFLATFNSVTNPFLYAWRFVDWRKLCSYFCKQSGSVSLTTGSRVVESKQNIPISN